MKELNKRLPPFWVVLKINRIDPRFQKVLSYMNSITNNKYCIWDGYGNDKFYGFDGSTAYNGCCVGHKNYDNWLNKPTYLTLDQFDIIYSITEEQMRQINASIDPDAMYYVNYDLDNNGKRVYVPLPMLGRDLTQYQAITAELVIC